MASIIKRGGSWRVQIRKGKYKHNPIVRTFTKKTVADAWAQKVEIQIEDGTYVDGRTARGYSMQEVIERYEKELLVLKGEGSQISESTRWKVMKEELAGYTLDSLDKDTLVEIYKSFLTRRKERDPENTWSKTYVDKFTKDMKKLYDVMQNLWNYPLSNGHVGGAARAYMSEAGLLKGANRRRKTRFKTDGYLKVRHYQVKKPNTLEAFYKYAMLFAMETGVRVGELKDMKIDQINWREKTYYLESVKNDHDRDTVESGRLVPLNRRARAILKLVLRYNPRKDRPQNANLVWPWTGTHRGSTIYQGSMKILDSLGIRDGKAFHTTRHEFGSHTLDMIKDIGLTGAAMGHRDLKSTKGYVHTDESIMADVLNANIRK